MKKTLNNIGYVAIFYVLISVIWILGEKIFYGEVTPLFLHDFIAAAFAISLFYNWRHFIEKKLKAKKKEVPDNGIFERRLHQ